MKTKKYFIIPFLTLLACSCQDEEHGVQPTPGEDVKFGAGLEQNASRTIYGPENDNGFPIYWVDGDEVIVSSPECAKDGGVGSATYKVHVESETQNYATSLDKTGEIGVRWGDNSDGNFYSVYPVSSSHTKLGSDYKTVTLTMPAQQDNNIVTENGIKIIRSDMRSCFMYAAEAGVESGATVNLKYKPLSTAVRFKLFGPLTNDQVTINYVRIYAPQGTYISGTFNVDLSTATDGNLPTMIVTNGRNYVTMNAADAKTGAYLTLGQNESIEMNAFLLIANETQITSSSADAKWEDSWYIEIGTSSGISYKKRLNTSDGTIPTLVPGKVHRLPDLPNLSSAEWDAKNWMANLQRNVYLSEISIPGTWYSRHAEYQPVSNDLKAQYNIGVRAFHLDTRWRASRPWGVGWEIEPLGVVDDDKHTIYRDGTGTLTPDKYLNTDAPTFESCLDDITECVQPDEYMVVICTFAQGSGNATYNDKNWIQYISEICNNNEKVIVASNLNQNSTVADVLGRVIVIVNTFTTTNIPDGKCFFMDIPISQTETEFKGDVKVDLKYYNSTSSGITVYGTHAQQTAALGESGFTVSDENISYYVPTISERENMAGKILEWSKENYKARDNYSHSIWMYLGMGGYIKQSGGDDYSTVPTQLNAFIGNKVEEMYVNESYYPIGIVLMNNLAAGNLPTLNYGLAQSILEMNNKYRKAYDPNRSPVDGSNIVASNGVQSAAPGYSSGMKDNQTDAIGWTRCR